ncbi:hypothetical protein CEXT_102581 [Caerostris extrusa]|uniref:Uncharacterized protein n=1 Tax=Caerostris extrusa TaxID=172846 RepID=A0AAV4TVR3_CAEEX|nr:hypothetical protein CEXT_102581 [Caerostris extrusa]
MNSPLTLSLGVLHFRFYYKQFLLRHKTGAQHRLHMLQKVAKKQTAWQPTLPSGYIDACILTFLWLDLHPSDRAQSLLPKIHVLYHTINLHFRISSHTILVNSSGGWNCFILVSTFSCDDKQFH